MDVADWLRKLGLEQYEPAFRTNEIDERVLPSLPSEDLREMGVGGVHGRRHCRDAPSRLGPSLDAISPDRVAPRNV